MKTMCDELFHNHDILCKYNQFINFAGYMKVENFREFFPILKRKVYGKPLVYFDNAATAQRPLEVVEAMDRMNLSHNANTHRAVHLLSAEATEAYELARDTAAAFIGSPSREQVIFTSGATAGLNALAYSFCEAFLKEGDKIIIGEAEHHSNFVPWQILAARKKAEVVYWRVEEDGSYCLERLEGLLDERVKIVCVAHAGNVLGIVHPIRRICELCHAKGVYVAVDGAQGAVHCKVDVQEMDCDFYALSAHKLMGPTGVGILYGRKELLEAMPPFMCGGEMVQTVSLAGTTYAPLPLKFEAGTPNFCNAAALTPALKIMDICLKDKELLEETEEIKLWLWKELENFPGLTLYGSPERREDKLPIFSFNIEGVHHSDLAALLDKMGVAVRSGMMCAEPLMAHFGVTGMVRVSLMAYNSRQEAEYFMECLRKAIAMLK